MMDQHPDIQADDEVAETIAFAEDETDAAEQGDEGDAEAEADDAVAADDGAAAEEFVIEIEGEQAEDETPVIRKLRDELREAKREAAELRKAQAPKVEDIGPRPKIEDFDFDDDRHAAALEQWLERKRQVEAVTAKAGEQAAQIERAFEHKVATYRAKAASLPVKDFEQAEGAVRSVLPEAHQRALVYYGKDPAKVVYALAKHPAKLQQMAQIADPVEFLLAAAELERGIKMGKKAPPKPEAGTILRGSAPVAQQADKKEAELRKEAQRTGDYSKLISYRNQRKKQGG